MACTGKASSRLHAFEFFRMSSPTKSEFIRAKYQMLAFVHKLPCRDDDGVTTKDLSKVRTDFTATLQSNTALKPSA